MKKKKAIIFQLGLIFVLLQVLITGFFVVADKRALTTGVIGERQLAIAEAVFLTEFIKFDLQQSTELASCGAFEEVVKNAALPTDMQSCGVLKDHPLDHNQYVFWNNEENECFPTLPSIKESFTTHFKTEQNKFLPPLLDRINKRNRKGIYPDVIDLDMELEQATGKKETIIHAIPVGAVDTIIYSSVHNNDDKKIKVSMGQYRHKPSFSFPIEFNIEDITLLTDFAKETAEECKNKPSDEDRDTCVENKLAAFLEQDETTKEEFAVALSSHKQNSNIAKDIFFFDILLKNANHYCFTSPQHIRFALFIPTKEPQAITITLREGDIPKNTLSPTQDIFFLQRGIPYELLVQPRLTENTLELVVKHPLPSPEQGPPEAFRFSSLERINEKDQFRAPLLFQDLGPKEVVVELIDPTLPSPITKSVKITVVESIQQASPLPSSQEQEETPQDNNQIIII